MGMFCFAGRVDPSLKTTSTSFSVKAEPPTLSCRDDALVENGAAATKLCLLPLEMRTITAAVGLLPTGETSTAIRTTLDYSTLLLCQIEGTHYKKTKIPSAWFESSFRRYKLLTPSPAGASLRQNPGKIGYLIQAVLKVVSAPARL